MTEMSHCFQQRTDAWYKARRGKLTASNFGTVLGLCPWQSRKKLWARMLDPDTDTFKGNVATQWGTDNEPNGILEYMATTGNEVKATGFHVHKALGWLGGSPDGFVGDDGMIEVKCPYNRKVQREVPLHYYAQINGLLEVTGRQWCDFVSWTPEEICIIRIKANHTSFDWLMNHSYLNFFASVCNKQEPPRYTPDEVRILSAQVAHLRDEDMLFACAEWGQDIARPICTNSKLPVPDESTASPDSTCGDASGFCGDPSVHASCSAGNLRRPCNKRKREELLNETDKTEEREQQ